jgi:hypothetical protein
MVSTIWGICFSLKANPNGSNEKSFDTVLTRCDEAEKPPRRLEFVILPLTRSAQLGSLAGRIASE